jgi:hypothetical protein
VSIVPIKDINLGHVLIGWPCLVGNHFHMEILNCLGVKHVSWNVTIIPFIHI